VNRPKNDELRAPSSGEYSPAQSRSPSFIDLTRLSNYLIAQGFVETETTYATDDTETITYHLTDKGLKLLGELL
jgi:hypothetical protein